MRVNIVGGGIIGVVCAYYLLRSGCEVVLIEKESALGSKSTYAAGGIMMHNCWNPRSGLWHEFAEQSFSANKRLEQELFDGSINKVWSWCGRLHLATNDKELTTFKSFYDSDSAKYDCSWISEADICKVEPSFSGHSVGGYLNNGEGKISPLDLIDLLVDEMSNSKNFTLVLSESISEIIKKNEFELAGVKSPRGNVYYADKVVFCAGAYSTSLKNINVYPKKGQAILFDKVPPPFKKITYINGVWFVPRGESFMIGATVEDDNFNEATNISGLNYILSKATQVAPWLTSVNTSNFKMIAGLRPYAAQDHPLIEYDSEYSNLLWVTGHGSNGIFFAARTGEIVAAAISSGELCTV
ncbi:NAD(P)/FAD-dependent oxidoreductase [Pseudomonas sp.]|uniref:NAD(P)/FAD-dependent oxidoreductase n=1 Tax=Pseudomonas sp. TaxID=306 RepID=UPI003C77C0FF